MAENANRIGLPALLRAMVEQDASDLHITIDVPPEFRISGKMVKVKMPSLTGQEAKEMCYSVITDAQKAEYMYRLILPISRV